MSAGVGSPPEQPPTLGELLVALHRADVAFDEVHVSYRIWHHLERVAAAAASAREAERRQGARSTTIQLPGARDRPVETEEVLALWRSGARTREERRGGARDGDYEVHDGDAWWSWSPTRGAVSNEIDLSVGGGNGGEQVSLMLDPTPLLGVLRFEPIARRQFAGRAALTAVALPRPRDPRRQPLTGLNRLGYGADRYELAIDEQRGVLLEAVALYREEPLQRITVLELEFDHAIPAERFRFVAPPGEPVRAPGFRHAAHLTVPEAQRRAPFTVLVPDRIPSQWQVDCTFSEATERPPSPASVSIGYRSNDGHEGIRMSEYAAGQQWDQYDLMIADGEWQSFKEQGATIQARSLGTQAQCYIERDGTFVWLNSESLPAGRLAAIAAALRPARSQPLPDSDTPPAY